jgi:hypothetical protein
MMRMDLYGSNKKTPWTWHFGANQAIWDQIATYVCKLAPEIAARCNWYCNGDGLNGEDSLLLANLLQKEIESGGAMNYAVEVLDPHELCFDCNATGRAGGYPPHDSIVCARCNGEAWVPSAEKRELFVSWLRQFAEFQRDCGGFQSG